MSRIHDVCKDHTKTLLAKDGVVAVGVGRKKILGMPTDQLAVVVSVKRKKALAALDPKDVVPREVDGEVTDVVETGPFKALALDRTARYRPAPPGVSVGHKDITAGTLGCVVRRGTATYVLSNNHVLANSNDAVMGDAILQPGPYDGGRLGQDELGYLAEFVPISFLGDAVSDCRTAKAVSTALNGVCALIGSTTRYRIARPQALTNLVDCAIADVEAVDVTDSIVQIGPPRDPVPGELGMTIKKSGRTTELTAGRIEQVNVTVQVAYDSTGSKLALFEDQLMAGAMSQGGDSGSAVVNDDNALVGLLFAGSDTSTIICRMEHVFEQLNITL